MNRLVQNDEEVVLDSCFVDPRASCLGLRVYSEVVKDLNDDLEVTKSTEKAYQAHRLLNGVGEGVEIEGQIPFGVNADFLNGVSLSKGCYLGQEIIARTFHTGIVRKRALPFLLSKSSSPSFKEGTLDFPFHLTEDPLK